jgi:membrane protease YdiL (CAAX protease family)
MDRPFRIYLWLAFGITWGFGGLALLSGAYRPGAAFSAARALHYVAAFGPSMAGIIMAAHLDGWPGLRAMFSRAVPRWPHWPWYLAVIVGFPAANLAAAWLVSPESLGPLHPWGRLIYGMPATLVMDTGPLGEEFGWRGFALPRLLGRVQPLAAALILGTIWWAWHLPTFFISTLSQSELSIPMFLINSLALSVIMTWLYRRTRGDLSLMILVHVAANCCGGAGVPFRAEVSAEVACAALIVAAGGLRSDSPQVRSVRSRTVA